MGGEKFARNFQGGGHLGSPPRGRGKGRIARRWEEGEGITPAWAGKSPSVVVVQVLGVGSPPRGRGKAEKKKITNSRYRITPAWAGKSRFRLHPGCVQRDHPRVGGEKRRTPARRRYRRGSPPRGRGKGGLLRTSKISIRITPAWAGKRASLRAAGWKCVDHPRVGGEKCRQQLFCRWSRGSPPRGRGKDRKHYSDRLYFRITPAWAGKRTGSCSRRSGCWDHPRVGGEKRTTLRLRSAKRGSPPRGRGKAILFSKNSL